ncbi:MAG TPA: LuxR C-terminal-related transcriptional regulator [Gaiellaceae bacterium]|nr:LuxR C-terminal-related transcriptional regulator [Gaiellaceae bacterium]
MATCSRTPPTSTSSPPYGRLPPAGATCTRRSVHSSPPPTRPEPACRRTRCRGASGKCSVSSPSGYANREIAKRLYISVRTAETHRAHVMQKLGLGTRADLVHHALRVGLLDPTEPLSD